MKFLRKMLAVVLALAMTVCSLTVTAFAGEQSANSVAKVGDEYYDSLADAIAAAPADGTVTLIADCTISSQIKITKSITLTTDGNGDHTIYVDSSFTSGWAIDWGQAFSKILGTATSRIIIDGSKLNGTARTRGLLYVHAKGCQVEYVTVQNNVSTPDKDSNGGGGIYCSSSQEEANPTVFKNITVKNCKTTSVGNAGGMNIATYYVQVYNSQFINNTAAKLGEQIYITSSAVDVIIDGCTFTRNSDSDAIEVSANKADTSTVSNCTFDVKKSKALDNSTSTSNKFYIAAPTQTETTMEDTGIAIDITSVIDGFDADLMTASITKDAESETEINGVGAYVITVSPIEEHYFPAEATTEFAFTVTPAAADVAEYNSVKYKSVEAAIAAASEGDTVVILEDIDSCTISKNVIIDTATNGKTIASALVTAAALPLDLSQATISAVTFDKDVKDNTIVFTGDRESQVITNEGKILMADGSIGSTVYTVADVVATIGVNRYDDLAAAVADADAGDEILLHKDVNLATSLTINKAVTIAVSKEAEKDIVITSTTQASSDYMINVKANVVFAGTETANIVLQGNGNTYDRPLFCVQNATEFYAEYLVVQDSKTTYKGGGLYFASSATGASFNNCKILNNTSSSKDGGGACYFASGCNVDFYECEFTGNSNTGGPGGVFQIAQSGGTNPGTVTATNCLFKNNTAKTLGAVARVNGALTLDGCSFIYNYATDGDISEGNTTAYTRNIMNCNFDKSEARSIVLKGEGSPLVATDNKFLPGITEPDSAIALEMFCMISDTITAVFTATIDETTAANYDSIVLRAKLGDGDEIEIARKAGETGDKYFFEFENIYSQSMTDVITGSVIGIKAGELDATLGVVEGMSIATYLDAVADNGIYNENEKIMSFIANMLAFGEACQVYLGYNTENLATTDRDWVDTYVADETPVAPDVELSIKEKGCKAKIFAAGLHIENKISVYFQVRTNTPENTTVLIDDVTYSLAEENPAITVDEDGIYTIRLDCINPYEYDRVISAMVFVGENLQQTVNYSVNTYCANMAESETLGDLVRAIYNYGASAIVFN